MGKRLIHFDVHQLEHAWLDQFDYEEKADDFLTKPLTPPVMECFRKRDGALVRYDASTGEFGILHATGFIGTYHYQRHRGAEYFQRECQR